ncbi:MAG: dihydrodipicolinate synthase family protein [Deltaproteobacteria bacterium]|nr:dihydrodipicolinate synthase family protein [Deltaproteobacteria bacterium]
MKQMKDSIIPPITTPIVDGEISQRHLKSNIEKWNKTRLGGYLVLGSTGEAPLLSYEEKIRVIAAAREATPPGKVLVAGTGEESTRKTIELTRKAAELGAEVALVGNPHYFKAQLTMDCLYDHYVALADASPIPVIPYNSPGFTGINMTPDLIGRLSRHPNVVGVKDGTGNVVQLAGFRRLGGPDFLIFSGNAPSFLAALFVGISGGMMPITNLYPDLWVDLLEHYRTGALEDARRLEARLLPMTATVMKYGVGGMKVGLDILGFYGGSPLMPLKAPQPEAVEEIRTAMEKVAA